MRHLAFCVHICKRLPFFFLHPNISFIIIIISFDFFFYFFSFISISGTSNTDYQFFERAKYDLQKKKKNLKKDRKRKKDINHQTKIKKSNVTTLFADISIATNRYVAGFIEEVNHFYKNLL